MRDPRVPAIDERRAAEFLAELQERARIWIPEWGVDDDPRDFGRALLEIAARFNSEVAERLDRVGEKMQRGLLDWLAVARQAARPARAPVVFRLTETATLAVNAPRSVQLQADVAGSSVIFETEAPIRLCPGLLSAVVAVDDDRDAFYLPPPDIFDLSPPEPRPTQWLTKTTAPADPTRLAESSRLQLDPEAGLTEGMMINALGSPHRITKVDKDLVTIVPALTADLIKGSAITRIATFDPFRPSAIGEEDPKENGDQEHILYIGDDELLNLESAAVIKVDGVETLPDGLRWEYWGREIQAESDDDAAPVTESEPSVETELGWRALDSESANPVQLRKEHRGALEPLEIQGRTSRWIRAVVKSLSGATTEFRARSLQLRIQSSDWSEGQSIQDCPPTSKTPNGPIVQAMANSTPLVVDKFFYPLGREPRLFDAFYIGCAEAFSKTKADVGVCLDVSSSTCESFAAVRVGEENRYILAGVGKNQALQLMEFKPSEIDEPLKFLGGPSRPPSSSPGDERPTAAAPERLNTRCRPVMWLEENGSTVSVAVAAGNQVWLWRGNADEPNAGGWERRGEASNDSAPIEDLVPRADGKELLAALVDGLLFVYEPEDGQEGTWEDRTPKDEGLNETRIASIAPVDGAVDEEGGPIDRIIAVSREGGLHFLWPGANPTDPWRAKRLQGDGLLDNTVELQPDSIVAEAGASPSGDMTRRIHPAARIVQGQLTIAAVANERKSLIALRGILKDNEPFNPAKVTVGLNDDVVIGDAVTLIEEEPDGPRVFVTTSRGSAASRGSENYLVASWAPTFPDFGDSATENPNVVRKVNLPITTGSGAGTPLVVADRIVVPGPREDAYLAALYASVLFKDKVIGEGVVFPKEAVPKPEKDQFLSIMLEDGKRQSWTIEEVFNSSDNRRLYPIPADKIKHRAAVEPAVIAYRYDGKEGTARDETTFTVSEDPSPGLEKGMIARIQVDDKVFFSKVEDIQEVQPEGPGEEGEDAPPKFWIVEIEDEVLPVAPEPPEEPPTLTYWEPTSDFGDDPPDVRPMIRFAESGEEALRIARRLREPILNFAVESSSAPPEPAEQRFSQFGVDSTTNLAAAIVLAKRWTNQPPPLDEATPFSVQSVLGDGWRRYLGPTATNPELSWEYWNGRGWWSLDVHDGTARLANTGTVSFTVPTDIAPTDLSGKTDYWIRARLIGGDYGRESVTITTKNIEEDGVQTGTVQTVDRSEAGIRAPQLISIHVSYGMRGSRRPAWVLTRDGGTTRDQSDANRSKDAIIEAFTPIGKMLERFERGGPETALQSPSSKGGRSLFLGLTASPSEGPVRILLLIDKERADDAGLTPLAVDALVADQFVKVVTQDETRALGESGILTMFFNLAPTQRELFGRTLHWLRLRPNPSGSPSEPWSPKLRGAYLNGVWASAQETLTRERLGSSDGSPSLKLQLARPPVLRDTLELRVREPLGEEERRRLRDLDPDGVQSDVEGLPGDWVLWKQVVDPGDEPAGARVYALDEATGEVRFGDGEHGRIPPIGVDAIVAFSYSRAEPGVEGSESVPANAVEARTPLNLVSPIESVDSVVVADQAAGGQPSESDERVLRFGHSRLRHRGRGVTGRDVEDLILQSSPDFVQARALPRPGGVRVVVVRRGADPRPSVAQIRELTRLARSVGPAALTAPGALEIVGPTIKHLRIHMSLLIEDLDFAGSVTTEVVSRLLAFFDPATGGPEKTGWPPGANVTDKEVALAIFDVPHLLSIECLTLEEIGPEGASLWPETLEPDEIPSLAADSIDTADSINIDIKVPQANS